MARPRDMQMITVITVVVLLCAGQASASYKKCYADCYSDCQAKAGEVTSCVAKCLFKCLKVYPVSDSPDSCNHHCLISECAPFGSDTTRVVNCADNCDQGRCKK